MLLKENLETIRKRVNDCGRDITMVAASKTQSSETIDELMALAPEFVLGENRVQEFSAKYNPAYRWQFIGQLQTNKVKYIIDKVELIHSLDREELASEIERQAAKRNIAMPCLVEVNMGSEISKGGIAPDKMSDFVGLLEKYAHIEVAGIMAVMPNLGDTPELHGLYEKLHRLFEEAKTVKTANADIKYLSAGMSNDYQIALQHGANIIRLGRTLFGERVYMQSEIAEERK